MGRKKDHTDLEKLDEEQNLLLTEKAMKCSIQGYPGEYEERKIVHTVRHKGQVIVIDHVPAEVCSVCGDVLFRPETVRQIEELLRSREQPVNMVPVFKYV